MPDIRELGRKVKAKYPVYNDLSDEEVGRRAKAKFPGAYDDFTETAAAQPPPAPAPSGFRGGISGLAAPVTEAISVGAQRIGANLGETALAIADFVRGAQTGDVRPAAEIGERAIRTVASLIGEGAGGGEIGEAVRDPAGLAAAQQRSETRRLTESPFKEGFQGVRELQRSADVQAARDPSLTGKIIRRGTEFVGLAAPAVATGIATGGSLPALATLATLQSAGQPETLPLNVALEAGSLPVAQAFRAGINTVRRQLGKGAAQIIEAEATPAAIAQVRREIGEIAPPVVPEMPRIQAETPLPATQTGAAIPTPAATAPQPVGALPTVFAKLGTDNVDQIAAMIANANRRFRKRSTPEQRASAVADYNALRQLTREEHDALSLVLPERGFNPVAQFEQGGTAREIRDIPASERNAQLDANLRQLETFFGAEGRALQAAEDAAILGDIGPGATSGQIVQPARVSAADLVTAPPPPRVAPPQPAPSAIADRIRTMARTPTSPVSVAEVRRQFPGLGKKEFDDEMVRLVEEGQIALHRHDAPGQLTAAQRDAMVKIGDNYFTAATVREAPSVRAAAAGVAGPRVGADMELKAAAGGAGRPPEPPFFSPDEPFEPPFLRNPLQERMFSGEPLQERLLPNADIALAPGSPMSPIPRGPRFRELFPRPSVPTGFGDLPPGPQAHLFDFAPSLSRLTNIWQRTKDELFGALGATKSLKSSIDISYPFRQGALLLLRPLQWRQAAKVWQSAFKGFRTKNFEEIKRAIELHPLAKRMEGAGLHRGIVGGEEAFPGRAGSKISAVVEKTPGIKQSQQAFTAAADTQRVQAFEQYARAIDRAGLSTAEALKADKAAAEWINIATGRGSLGQKLDKALEALNFFFFSPRYVASRLNILNPVMYIRNAASPGGRVVLRQQMADLAQFMGVTATTLYLAKQAGADVGLIPESPDFLKIRIGNHRYDTLAGLQQLMRAGYRIGADIARAARGEKPKFGESAIDIGETFLSYKLAPPASVFRSFINQRTPGGKEFTAARAAAELVAPMQWADFVDAWRDESFGSALMSTPGATGIGHQHYEFSPVEAALDRNRPLLAEVQRLKIRVAELQRKKDKDGNPEPDDLFNARVQQFSQNYTGYGLRLIQHPRFQIASDDVKTRALKRLNEKAKGLTHEKYAFPEIELDPGLILDSVEK